MSFVSKHHSSVEQFNDLIMLNVTINQLELGPLTFFFYLFNNFTRHFSRKKWFGEWMNGSFNGE